MNKWVIEFPAGLAEAGENMEMTALRELKEESGYVGKALEKTPVLFNGSILFLVLPLD